MPLAHKGAISFGLVYIPVELYTATQDNDIRFNQLAKDNLARVRYVKTCDGCKKELKPGDIVKGFQYEKGKYVVVTDEDMEAVKTEKDRSIQILQFVALDDIPSEYFNKSYQVLSVPGGEKPFALLREAMQQEGKVAIGKTVLGNSETLLALVPTNEGMLMETLFYHDEIREVPRTVQLPQAEKAELDIARQLIKTMEKPFKPEEYKDEHQQKLRDLIQKKIEGQEIVAEDGPAPDNVINLMDALKQSLAQNKKPAAGAGSTAKKPPRTRRKSG